MEKISVIVPVYKVEKYLRRCVNSLIDQTYKNLEIILVNDGSPDECGKICDHFAEMDDRITVIHQKNGGQSSARNTGLKFATGDFLGFVDSDDWIQRDMYQLLYENLKNFNCDLSICQRINVRDESDINEISNSNKITLYECDDIIDFFLKNDMLAVYNKLYRRELFDNVTYPIGKIHEDIFLTYKIMTKSKKIVISDAKKYCYFLGGESTTRSPLNINDFNMIEEWDKVIEDLKVNYPNMVQGGIVRLYISYFNLINKYVMHGAKDKNTKIQINDYLGTWISCLRKSKLFIQDNAYVKLNNRIQIFLLVVSFKLFKVCKKGYIRYLK